MSHANSLNVEHWNNFDEHVDGLYTHPDKWCGKKVMEHNSYSNADLLWEENNRNMSHQLRSIFLMFLKSFSSIKSFKFTSETEAKLSAILSLSLSRQKFWEHHTYDGLTYLADCLFFCLSYVLRLSCQSHTLLYIDWILSTNPIFHMKTNVYLRYCFYCRVKW